MNEIAGLFETDGCWDVALFDILQQAQGKGPFFPGNLLLAEGNVESSWGICCLPLWLAERAFRVHKSPQESLFKYNQ